MKRSINTLCIFSLSALMWNCSGGNQTEQTAPVQEEIVIEIEEDSGDDDDFSFVMPSALQINSIFQRTGSEFMDGKTNPTFSATNYASKVKKLLNLGVYTSDLAYVVLNDQSQIAMDYLKTVKRLSDEVGMSSVFNSGPLLERFEKNIGNRDSIITIMADIQEETDIYIRKSDQDHLAMIIFAGAWVEGMYLGLTTAPDDKKDVLTARLLEQTMILKNLNKGLENQPYDTEEINAVKDALLDLENFFKGIEGFNADEFNFDDVNLTSAQMDEMTKKISAIRTNIVNA